MSEEIPANIVSKEEDTWACFFSGRAANEMLNLKLSFKIHILK